MLQFHWFQPSKNFTWTLKTRGHLVIVPHVKAQLRTSKGLTFGRDINLARQGLFFHVVSTVQHSSFVGRAVWSLRSSRCGADGQQIMCNGNGRANVDIVQQEAWVAAKIRGTDVKSTAHFGRWEKAAQCKWYVHSAFAQKLLVCFQSWRQEQQNGLLLRFQTAPISDSFAWFWRCLSLHRRTLDAFGVPTAFEHRQVVGASKLIMMRSRQDPGDFIRFGASCGFLESLHPGKLTWNLKITYLKRKLIFQTFTIVFHVDLQGCTVSV